MATSRSASRLTGLLGRIRQRTDASDGEPWYSSYFNTPVKFHGGEWYVNERIVELAFVHHHLHLDGTDKRLLDLGCTRSDLAMQLAALGYQVVGYTFAITVSHIQTSPSTN